MLWERTGLQEQWGSAGEVFFSVDPDSSPGPAGKMTGNQFLEAYVDFGAAQRLRSAMSVLLIFHVFPSVTVFRFFQFLKGPRHPPA